MTIFLTIVAGLALLFVLFAIWVRVAPNDPAQWHIADPASFPDPSTPNYARIDRQVELPLGELSNQIAARARDEGATLLAGDEQNGTWLVRTAVMAYPDFVSLKLTEISETTTLVQGISRSRFGYGDMGANRARLRRWIPQ